MLSLCLIRREQLLVTTPEPFRTLAIPHPAFLRPPYKGALLLSIGTSQWADTGTTSPVSLVALVFIDSQKWDHPCLVIYCYLHSSEFPVLVQNHLSTWTMCEYSVKREKERSLRVTSHPPSCPLCVAAPQHYQRTEWGLIGCLAVRRLFCHHAAA